MNIEKLLEITQALEIGVDEFYKEEQEKLEELKNMPYSVAKESYASTKQIIDNRDLTYTLIEDLKTKLDKVKELDETRTLAMELKQQEDTEEIEDLDPDFPQLIRRVNVRPRLRRFLLSDSSISRLHENAKIDEVPVIQDSLEEIVNDQIDEDIDQILRIRSELLAEKKNYVSKPSAPEIEVQPSIDFSVKEEMEEEESGSSDGYFGFIDATAVLDNVNEDVVIEEDIVEESEPEEEDIIDIDRILYIEKPNYSSKIRAIGLPDRQLMDIINSRSEEIEAIRVLNEKCREPIHEPIRKEKIVLKDSTDIFTNSFDEDFQKALDIEPKRRIDKTKISEREKALKDLAQMEE